MSGKKCKHCGSAEIEVDPARGDAVCTNCGTVLEDNIIVAEVEFQQNSHGGASAIGQFVSSETKGGATGFGGAFNAGIGQESREITLKKARNGIVALCEQLRLNQQCIDIACNFFRMALSRNLTKGRPASHIHAACVYMTCRTEGTAHLLIDISDALQICCYQLGRCYLRLSRLLCITMPSVDPCLYILRFASQLQLGDRKHDVTMTALRMVQRMKKDHIHIGRRPSGLCGAALLIASRLHNFSRTPADMVEIVKVHESTIRKRLLEFGETPSSALTLEEFMTVDLEEEQDPPAFRTARKRDKDRLQKLIEEEDGERELTELQREIDMQLDIDNSRRKKIATPVASAPLVEDPEIDEDAETNAADASRFAAENALDILEEIVQEVEPEKVAKGLINRETIERGIGAELANIMLEVPEEQKQTDKFLKPEPKLTYSKDLNDPEDLRMNDDDEEFLDSILLNKDEVAYKTELWNKINASYIKEQKIKEEVKEKEKEQGKDRKRKLRGTYKKKIPMNAASAGEAIEKMLQEKRISSKINYDILRSLDQSGTPSTPAVPEAEPAQKEASPVNKAEEPQAVVLTSPVLPKRRRKVQPPTLHLPTATPAPLTPAPLTPAPLTPAPPTPAHTDAGDDDEDDVEVGADAGAELSLAAMLQNGQEEDYYGYDEY